jgi:hypothetical protein
MTVTEDRPTGRPEGDHHPPRSWPGTDERSMRWAMLGAFLLGLYAVVFVVLSVWLAP